MPIRKPVLETARETWEESETGYSISGHIASVAIARSFKFGAAEFAPFVRTDLTKLAAGWKAYTSLRLEPVSPLAMLCQHDQMHFTLLYASFRFEVEAADYRRRVERLNSEAAVRDLLWLRAQTVTPSSATVVVTPTPGTERRIREIQKVVSRMAVDGSSYAPEPHVSIHPDEELWSAAGSDAEAWDRLQTALASAGADTEAMMLGSWSEAS